MNSRWGFDPFTAITEAELESMVGAKVGDEVKDAVLGKFVLAETSVNLLKGNVLTGVRLAFDVCTYDHAAKTLSVADAGATYAAGRLAGFHLHIDDNGTVGAIAANLGYTNIVAKSAAGVSGSAMLLTLLNAFPQDISTLTDIDITIYDPNYIKLSIQDELCPVEGISPLIVTAATTPYFWMQVSGIAPVIMDDTAAFGVGIVCSNAVAGQAETVVADGAVGTRFGHIVDPAPAANMIAHCKLYPCR